SCPWPTGTGGSPGSAPGSPERRSPYWTKGEPGEGHQAPHRHRRGRGRAGRHAGGRADHGQCLPPLDIRLRRGTPVLFSPTPPPAASPPRPARPAPTATPPGPRGGDQRPTPFRAPGAPPAAGGPGG